MTKETYLVVTTMKNEGPFMLEWIAYNLSIGFNKFMIFTNDCTDGTDKIAMRLAQLGYGVHIDNNERGKAAPQRAALRQAPKHPIYAQSDWIICADADEFLNIRIGDGTLPDLVKACGEADAISLCWKLFGNSGKHHYDDVPLIEQFFSAAPENTFTNFRGAGMKTLFRNNGSFDHMGVHRPKRRGERGSENEGLYDGITWKDAGGNSFDANKVGWKVWKGFSHDFARLHHYSIRSADSFLVKRDRGRTNHVNVDQGREYYAAMNTNHERDYSILKRAPAMLKILKQLKSDKELTELHDFAVDWHRKKITELKQRDDWQEFIDMAYGVKNI